MSYGAYAQAGVKFLGAYVAMRRASSQYKAAIQQNLAEWNEFSRQQDVNEEVHDQQAEERMRMADAQMGTMIAAMADNGGAGTTNAQAFAGEIGYLEGADLQAILRNRYETHMALEAKKTASSWRAINLITDIGTGVQNTIWTAASSSAQTFAGMSNSQTDKGNGVGPGSGSRSAANRRAEARFRADDTHHSGLR